MKATAVRSPRSHDGRGSPCRLWVRPTSTRLGPLAVPRQGQGADDDEQSGHPNGSNGRTVGAVLEKSGRCRRCLGKSRTGGGLKR
jgi:hypothetical protein